MLDFILFSKKNEKHDETFWNYIICQNGILKIN
jgi:hypothetical protein